MSLLPAADLFRALVLVAALLGVANQSVGRDRVTIFFGGDTSHGESYQDVYESEGDPNILKERPYNAAFESVTPLMKGCDLVVLNLETTLTHRRDSPIQDKPSYLYSNPDRAPEALRELGVDAVSLANNHLVDFGPPGLRDTLDALDRVGIAGFGAGETLAAAERPFIRSFDTDAGAVRVAIISCFERRDWYEPFNYYAEVARPGVNAIDIGRLRQQIETIKASDPSTFVVVTPHWGENYVWRVERLRRTAEAMVAAGADMVIGHGAHRLQEVERIDGKWVFYSIGNFVFNSRGRFQSRRSPPYSLPLRVTLSRSLDADRYHVGVTGYPIDGDNLATDYHPRPVTLDHLDEVRDLLLAYDATGVLSREAAWGSDERAPCVALGSSTAELVERLPEFDPEAPPFPRGAGHWYFNADGEPPLKVWTYWPAGHQASDDILVVMPGTRRNGDVYRDAWIDEAERLGVLLLVPEFSKADYPTGHGYQHLNYFNAAGDANPPGAWAHSRVEQLFDEVADRLGLQADRYYFYGHSAGGQFVHRTMLTHPEARVHLAIAANSGWYTLPNHDAGYPEGLAALPGGHRDLAAGLQRRVVVLLGDQDTDANHSSLPRGEAARRQGPHRFARGHYFFDQLQEAAADLGIDQAWKLDIVPGVAHSNRGMTPAAADLIAEHMAARRATSNDSDAID